MKSLVIFGCGEIAELAKFYFSKDSFYKVVAFTVDNEFLPSSEKFLDLPVIPFEDVHSFFPSDQNEMFIALSYYKINKLRSLKYEEAKQKGYRLASYISSKATVLSQKPLGDNIFILENNTIQPFAEIGNNVTLWSGNHIGHHSRIGNHCFITSHVVISGGVSIGDFCFLGVNSTIRNGLTIGKGCVIGMGCCIGKDCDPDGLYAGSVTEREKIPASRLRSL